MWQRNHFFLIADMYLGTSEPIEDESTEEEEDSETAAFSTPWAFDFGLDKTAEFGQHAKGPTLHWNDQIQQTKSIGPWLDLTQSHDVE